MSPLKSKLIDIRGGNVSIRELANVCLALLDRITRLEDNDVTPPVPVVGPSMEQFLDLHKQVVKLHTELFPDEGPVGISGGRGYYADHIHRV